PMGTTTDYRPVYVSTTSNPISGGTIQVSHIDGSGTTTADYTETNGDIIKSYSNASWNIATGNGITGGTYTLRTNPGSLVTVNDVSKLRIAVPGATVGSPGTVTGTAAAPSITRTGLALADLGNDFRIGSTESNDP